MCREVERRVHFGGHCFSSCLRRPTVSSTTVAQNCEKNDISTSRLLHAASSRWLHLRFVDSTEQQPCLSCPETKFTQPHVSFCCTASALYSTTGRLLCLVCSRARALLSQLFSHACFYRPQTQWRCILNTIFRLHVPPVNLPVAASSTLKNMHTTLQMQYTKRILSTDCSVIFLCS